MGLSKGGLFVRRGSFVKRWVICQKVGSCSLADECLVKSQLVIMSLFFFLFLTYFLCPLLFIVTVAWFKKKKFLQDISLSLPLFLSSCFITLLSLWWFTQMWPGGSQMIVKSWLARGKSCMLMMLQRPFSLFSRSLVKGRESDGFPEMQDRLVRQALKEFPYPESQLLQQLVRQIAPIKIVSAEAPTKHYHRNRKRPGAFLVDLMDSEGSHHLIIICNIYITPNRTRLAKKTSQFTTRMNIRINTWNMPDNPTPTAKRRQTYTHPGTM